MSKRMDNISRFVSSTRNLALVQLLVGVMVLGAASAGTYFIHQEIRESRITVAEQPEAASNCEACDTEKASLEERIRGDYELILKQNGIIEQQNGQINAGNAALNQCDSDKDQYLNDLNDCRTTNQCEACPAPINLKPYTDQIAQLDTALNECRSANKDCPPPSPPCTYDGVPCFDVIESLLKRNDGDAAKLEAAIKELQASNQQLAAENGELQKLFAAQKPNSCSEEVASATSNLNGELDACRKQAASNTCEINGVSCEDVIADQNKEIAAMKKELSALKEKGAAPRLDTPIDLEQLDPEKLKDLEKLLKDREN